MNIRPTKGDAVTTRYCAAMTRDQTGNIQVVTLFAFLLQTTRSLTKKALHTRLDMADPVRRTLTYNALETNAKKEQQQNDYVSSGRGPRVFHLMGTISGPTAVSSSSNSNNNGNGNGNMKRTLL